MYTNIHSRFQLTRVTSTLRSLTFITAYKCPYISQAHKLTVKNKTELHPSGVSRGRGRLLSQGQMKIQIPFSNKRVFNFLTGQI